MAASGIRVGGGSGAAAVGAGAEVEEPPKVAHLQAKPLWIQPAAAPLVDARVLEEAVPGAQVVQNVPPRRVVRLAHRQRFRVDKAPRRVLERGQRVIAGYVNASSSSPSEEHSFELQKGLYYCFRKHAKF